MSNLSEFYTRTLALLNERQPMDNFRAQNRQPKLSDKGVIALSLAAECCGIDSERHLFKQLPNNLNGQIDRSVYNRRRRGLCEVIGNSPIIKGIRKWTSHETVDSVTVEMDFPR